MEKESRLSTSGTLYICATPIGNLGDITYRVVETLRSVDLIAAEDTRNSQKLLNYFEIRTPMTAYHEYNKYDKARYLVGELMNGKNVAVITDAGTPCISDPGEELVRQAAEAGISITSLPGPAAFVTALTLSGLPTRRICFEAFLPNEKADKKERTRILAELSHETRTILLYEAPHHLRKTLADLAAALGPARRAALCRELTKKHEEVLRMTLGEALEYYSTDVHEPRGEYVLVIEGLSPEAAGQAQQESWAEMSVSDHMQLYLDQGLSEKDAMKQVAKDRGVSKREIYDEVKR